jgi:hypothetical protein
MKLFFTWLVGVPLMVASLVAMPAVGRFVVPDNRDQQCLLDDQKYGMALAITDQGHRIACHARTVK